VRIQAVRHATLIVELAGRRLLVDPHLDPPGARPPVEGTPNQRRNPLVPLPEPPNRYVEGVDAALITHTHQDHLDATAIELLPWGLPLLVQPEDAETLRAHGFTAVTPVPTDAPLDLDGIAVSRTTGRHGTGEIGEAMAPVSGFVLQASGEPTLYLAGDTIWCAEVADAIDRHAPDVVVVNAGGARFTSGDPITMTAADVLETARRAQGAQVVATHMEAINHCLETRDQLAEAIGAAGSDFDDRIHIAVDGESIEVTSTGVRRD
jgi:L-ascorbate metabolism protein UlaG (beta-lactamase superfamily)